MVRNCGRTINQLDGHRLLRNGFTPAFVAAAFRCGILIGLAAALLFVWTWINRRYLRQ